MRDPKDMTQQDLIDAIDSETRLGNTRAAVQYLEILGNLSNLADSLRLCRQCLIRRPPSNAARYCYVSCAPRNNPGHLDPDPNGNLRRVYDKPQTIGQLMEHLATLRMVSTHQQEAQSCT